jgi:hypothetical protein
MTTTRATTVANATLRLPRLLQELKKEGHQQHNNDNDRHDGTGSDHHDRDDDALFVLVSNPGQQVLSQWFMAVASRHPLMYFAIEEATFRVLQAKMGHSFLTHRTTDPERCDGSFLTLFSPIIITTTTPTSGKGVHGRRK